jgi:hypothetical protein
MTVRIITDSNGRKHITSEPLLHQPAPVMTDEKGRPVSFWGGKSVEPIAQPAPVRPVALLKEVDVLMMAETHGIDPSTKGLYGFYIDCISNQPAAQPAPVQEPVGEKEISAWAERHDIQGTPTDLRSMFEDAASFTTPPAQPAPVQEPVAYLFTNVQSGDIESSTDPDYKEGEREMWFRERLVRPAAQPAVQEPDHGDELTIAYMSGLHDGKKLAAQPAVPDAIHHTDLSEHPQYIEGWNDCRQAMLEMMK